MCRKHTVRIQLKEITCLIKRAYTVDLGHDDLFFLFISTEESFSYFLFYFSSLYLSILSHR